MARKAVQGYSEKSFYDNTRFLGMLAHTDMNNEGYFRHIVNFDYADTGLSVQPRRGFLTTTLVDLDGHPIILSDETVLYKDHKVHEHIIYDIKKQKAYIVDVTSYRINQHENKYLLPISHAISRYDYDDVIRFLFSVLPELKAEYDKVAVNVNQAEQFLKDMRECFTLQDRNSLLTIRDLNLIRKGLVKLKFKSDATLGIPTQEYDLLVELVYRKDNTDTLVEDTLVLMPVDTQVQESLTDRNIASYTNILPVDAERRVIQRLYTETDRPVGHVNTIAPNLYTRDITTPFSYYYTYVYPNKGYLVTPYFTLDPADMATNKPGSFWAYQVEIGNTQVDSNLPSRYVSPWFKYEPDKTGKAETIFKKPTDDNSKAVEVSARHYKGATVVVTLVPSAPNLARDLLQDAYNVYPYMGDGITFVEDTTYSAIYNGYNFDTPYDEYTGKTTKNTQFNEAYNNIVDVLTKSTIYDYVTGRNGSQRIYFNYKHELLTGPRDLYTAWRHAINSNKTDARNIVKALNENPTDTLAYVQILTNAYSDTARADFRNNIELDAAGTWSESNYSRVSTNVQLVTLTELQELSRLGLFNGVDVVFKLLPIRFTSYLSQDGGHTTPAFEKFARLNYYGNRYRMYDGGEQQIVFIDVPTQYLFEVRDMYSGYEESYDFLEEVESDYAHLKQLRIETEELRTNTNLPFVHSADPDAFFTNGYRMYVRLRPYHPDDLENKNYAELKQLQIGWESTPYIASNMLLYGYDEQSVTTIEELLTREPFEIQHSKNYLVFEDSRLVVWYGNRVYVSQEGDYHDFRMSLMKEFNERIVKVIQFKTILLVFTVEHLYAIYRVQTEEVTKDSEGKETKIITIHWAQQQVLYNLLVDDKYADVIQVFNQMVLFYSSDGQMFMIKPSTTIDNETLFSLQYFNKSANDVLANYEVYMNERLAMYKADAPVIRKEDVVIKAQVSINFIKIIYSVPDVMTYILVYDVINNRYSTYDTLSFGNISDKMFIESGDLYLTPEGDKMYLTMPYTEPNHQSNYCDMHYLHSFKRVAINAYMDTGDLNLNNHLRKRIKDLYITFRNLSSDKLLHVTETELDGVVDKPFYEREYTIQEPNGNLRYATVEDHYNIVKVGGLQYLSNKKEVNINDDLTEREVMRFDLNENRFENNNLLFDFKDYNSSAIITHHSDIIGVGKVLRLKMQFVSRGLYKIQTFGVVYKERRL